MKVVDSNVPVGLVALKKCLDISSVRVIKAGRFDAFEVDFSAWRLSLTAVNPCIWIKANELALQDAAGLVAGLQTAAWEQGWHNCKILVFVDGAVDELLKQLPLGKSAQFILLDDNEQESLKTAVFPQQIMFTLLRAKISLLQLSPYNSRQPVTGGQFFGRQSEIDKVIQNRYASYLFIGIRRIGKTSLLKEIQRQLDLVDPPQKGQIRRIYIDCTVISSEDEFLQMLLLSLEQAGLLESTDHDYPAQSNQAKISDYYKTLHGQPITFFLDEFDRLIPRMDGNWPLLQILQTAVSSRKIRFVVAGYRQATQASTGTHIPFFNMFTPVRLMRLPLANIQQMVLNPMMALGITVQDPEKFVQQISQETAGLPNYLQYYCKILLAYAERTGNTLLTTDDFQIVHKNSPFRHFVLNTFMSNTSLLERAIVYAVIDEGAVVAQGQFNEKKILEYLEKRKLSIPYDLVESACNDLELAGVFNYVMAEYEFAIPLFQRLLRQMRDVSFLFERTREALQTEERV